MKAMKTTWSPTSVLVAVAVVTAVVVGAIAVARLDFSGRQGSGLSDRFSYDLDKYKEIDPALIEYEQTGEISVAMEVVRAVAVGPEDRVYVAGDRAVHVFDADGTKRTEIALDDRPRCLAADEGRLYVGMKTHVDVHAPDGKRTARWESLGERARADVDRRRPRDRFRCRRGQQDRATLRHLGQTVKPHRRT